MIHFLLLEWMPHIVEQINSKFLENEEIIEKEKDQLQITIN